MKAGKLWLLTVFVLIAMSGAYAQKSSTKKKPEVKKQTTKTTAPVKKTDTKTTAKKAPVVNEPAPDVVEDQKKVRNIVSVFTYMLNTLASSSGSARDKEVVVTESYSKIFRDSKVQIEDDLVANRLVVTNKDVMAYLKDVDFFFSDAVFELTIDKITDGTNPDGKHFYKVALTRNLKGTTTDGNNVNTTIPRFIEINYDVNAQDLKIVSIYTTEYSGKDALNNWWSQLSYEWQGIFKKKFAIADSASAADLRKIGALEELDLSNNQYITSLEPLSFLTKLKVLNVSNTGVADLIAIRNVAELKDLNISNTKVTDLSALRYTSTIAKLNISHTGVSDISVLEQMRSLQWLDANTTNVSDINPLAELTELSYLNLQGTKITDVSPIADLTKLTDINLGQTGIQDITAVKSLKGLTSLDVDSTRVNTLAALTDLSALKTLHANHTQISDLQPIQKLPLLEKVYVDGSLVQHATADAFMATNPKVLIIYDSKDLQSWWNGLSAEWKDAFAKINKTSTTPTKEELARLGLIDSVNIAGNVRIKTLEPVSKLPKLGVLIASETGITDLSPIAGATSLRLLDVSVTGVSDITPLRKLTKLKVLRADKTKIENLDALTKLSSLERVYVDNSGVQDFMMRDFIAKNNKTLIVYKTIHLKRWWSGLSSNWKTVFQSQLSKDTTASRENLHRLAESTTLTIKDVPIGDLSALSEFVALTDLHLSGTAITELPAMDNFKFLKSLHIANGPLQKLKTIGTIKSLEDLDISNTPIDDMRELGVLENVKSFNCAGTQVKRIDGVSGWSSLESLDCSNTRVGSIDEIQALPLKTLKIYNTKVSARQVENFKKARPECNVVYYR